jgi:hypothetical protein
MAFRQSAAQGVCAKYGNEAYSKHTPTHAAQIVLSLAMEAD